MFIQMFAGCGYMEEYPIARMGRDSELDQVQLETLALQNLVTLLLESMKKEKYFIIFKTQQVKQIG